MGYLGDLWKKYTPSQIISTSMIQIFSNSDPSIYLVPQPLVYTQEYFGIYVTKRFAM